MENLDYKLIEIIKIQPALITIILAFVAVMLIEVSIDFIMSVFSRKWHSPNGFKCRGSDRKNETK